MLRAHSPAAPKVIDLQPIFHHPTEIIYGITNPEFFTGMDSVDDSPIEMVIRTPAFSSPFCSLQSRMR